MMKLEKGRMDERKNPSELSKKMRRFRLPSTMRPAYKIHKKEVGCGQLNSASILDTKLWIQQAIRTEQLESVPHRYDEVGRGGEEGRLEAGGAALEGGVEGPQHQEVQQHDQGDPGRLQGVDHLKMIEKTG